MSLNQGHETLTVYFGPFPVHVAAELLVWLCERVAVAQPPPLNSLYNFFVFPSHSSRSGVKTRLDPGWYLPKTVLSVEDATRASGFTYRGAYTESDGQLRVL